MNSIQYELCMKREVLRANFKRGEKLKATPSNDLHLCMDMDKGE